MRLHRDGEEAAEGLLELFLSNDVDSRVISEPRDILLPGSVSVSRLGGGDAWVLWESLFSTSNP
jgi:hypothetical protein